MLQIAVSCFPSQCYMMLNFLFLPHYAEFQTRVRTLERNSKALKSDKTLLQEDISSLREQLTAKEKELREAKSSTRESQDELARLTDKSV